MTKTEKILLTLSIAFTGFALFFISNYPPKPALGSTSLGSEYNSTTTRDFNGVALTTKVLTPAAQVTNGTLGSVVITGAAAFVMNFYDSTTTGSHSDYPTTLLASIPSSTVAGTYTFDVSYHRGLVVEITGTAGTSTITYR